MKGEEKVEVFKAKVQSVKKFTDSGMRGPKVTVTKFNQSIHFH